MSNKISPNKKGLLKNLLSCDSSDKEEKGRNPSFSSLIGASLGPGINTFGIKQNMRKVRSFSMSRGIGNHEFD